MTALWIIGGIILLIALLLLLSVTVYVKIGETVQVKIGACGLRFTVFPSKEKEKKGKKPEKARRKKPEKPKAAVPEEKAGARSFSETAAFAVAILKAVVPGAVELVRKIRVTRMRVFLSVGAEDADTAAVRYGQTCAGVYGVLACIDKAMTLKVKEVNVVPDFVTGEVRYDISFCAKLRIGSAAAAALGILFKLAAVFLRRPEKRADAPSVPSQKAARSKQKERVESV